VDSFYVTREGRKIETAEEEALIRALTSALETLEREQPETRA
jgi:hypothetical protein